MNRRACLLAALAAVLAVVAALRWRFTPGDPPTPPLTIAGAQISAADVDALPTSPATTVQPYGPDPLQFGELRLPTGPGPWPVVVVIHGGCWTRGFATLQNTAPLASELTRHNVATWNIEYRQVGDAGGGWPGTFLDWGAAVDHLRTLAKSHPLDLGRVVVAGHSAGGHAALWISARHRLPAESPIRGTNPLPVHAAVAIDGPGDLAGFIGSDARVCGQPVIVPLMGGTPAEHPERFRHASPKALLPLGLPQFLIAASVLTPDKAEEYRAAAQAAGDPIVEALAIPDSGHFALIAPGQKACAKVQSLILEKALPQKSQSK